MINSLIIGTFPLPFLRFLILLFKVEYLKGRLHINKEIWISLSIYRSLSTKHDKQKSVETLSKSIDQNKPNSPLLKTINIHSYMYPQPFTLSASSHKQHTRINNNNKSSLSLSFSELQKKTRIDREKELIITSTNMNE